MNSLRNPQSGRPRVGPKPRPGTGSADGQDDAMLQAFHRAQETAGFFRAQLDGKLLRLTAGGDVVRHYPVPFEGHGIEESQGLDRDDD